MQQNTPIRTSTYCLIKRNKPNLVLLAQKSQLSCVFFQSKSNKLLAGSSFILNERGWVVLILTLSARTQVSVFVKMFKDCITYGYQPRKHNNVVTFHIGDLISKIKHYSPINTIKADTNMSVTGPVIIKSS